jgi:hypothetical protein
MRLSARVQQSENHRGDFYEVLYNFIVLLEFTTILLFGLLKSQKKKTEDTT